MTPLVALAAAAVLGTLAVAPLSPGGRALDALGILSLVTHAAVRADGRVRVAIAIALVLSAANAWRHECQVPVVQETRTARYRALVLGVLGEYGPSSAFAAVLDGGLRVLIRVRGAAPPPGTRIVVLGTLEPFDSPRNPGEPDGAAIERERGLDAQLARAEVLARSTASPWDARSWLPRAHAWALAQLRERLGEPGASIVAGELWGERATLPTDLHAEFQSTGTVHVLVTAGLHIGVVAAVAVALLSALGWPRAITSVVAIALVWAFVVWSGCQLPAARAAIMATAALAARAFGRASFSWNALAIAALGIAALRPSSVATPSFALSFSCVGAIFAYAPLLHGWLEERVALPAIVREAIVLTIATQLGTWPLTAAIFLQFSPYAILANLGVVPCVGASLVLGAAQLVCAALPPLAQAIANINGWVVAWILAVVRTLSALPGSAIVMTPAPTYCIAAYDAALLFCAWCIRRRHLTPGLAAALCAVALILQPPHRPDANLRITAIDVGQGEAILIQTPAHHALLVDTGGRVEIGPQTGDSVAERVGERIVVPFLLRNGIHDVDAIILTHPHGDHAGGAAPVMRRLRVGELADGGQHYTGHAYLDALATARAQGMPVIAPRAGDVWHTGDGVAMRVIGPSQPFLRGTGNDIDENSVVFMLQYKHFRMLFTGDAGTAAEQHFLREGIDLHADILKVGHHGSAHASSPAFIAAVHPRYAIISVGRHNVFGLPAPATLATLRRFGATVYRTDENGAVMVLTDGVGYSVTPTIESRR